MASPPQLEITTHDGHFDHIHNTITIGAENSGKTAFHKQLTSQPFPEDYIPTIGVDFVTLKVKYPEGVSKLSIW